MKKKIIEKLELPYDDGKGNFSSGSGEIHILRKVNEIIDVLNSWVFEPTLTIPSQSQKQPEGETIRNYNPEKGWDKYKKSKIEVREFDLVPKVELEKQPEVEYELEKTEIKRIPCCSNKFFQYDDLDGECSILNTWVCCDCYKVWKGEKDSFVNIGVWNGFEIEEPEKQEGWVEEWRKLSFEIGSITKHQADEIEGFISERIKEAREEGRTDVLERLEKWSTNPQQGVFYDVGCNCQERLLRFLSKLLKEKK